MTTFSNAHLVTLSQNMADTERPASGPASAPVHLERKLSSAPLPNSREGSFSSNEPDPGNFSDNELEEMLIERVQKGDRLAKFQLGQFYFERKILDKAIVTFERIRSTDFQAKYQLGVMYYDGLGTKADHVSCFIFEVLSQSVIVSIIDLSKYTCTIIRLTVHVYD